MTDAPPPLTANASLRWDVVARLLDETGPRTVLEIGAGQGAAGARLARRGAYLGIEPDAESFRVAHPRVTAAGGTLLRGTHADVPAGSTYDLVCAFEVLEHLEDDAASLAAWIGHIRPGGHLLLSVPAGPERFGPSDEMAGHYRRYSREGMRRLLTSSGLVKSRVVLYGWPLGYLLEAARNRLAIRVTRRTPGASPAERTAVSGRLFQPGQAMGMALRVGTVPFRWAQRKRPDVGTGMVVLAQRPI